jgi:predicted RNase H-like HicB family nuclease
VLQSIVVLVHCRVFKEGDTFVSHCLELDTMACGKTLDDVRANTEEMIKGYFAAAEKIGTIDEVLKKLTHMPDHSDRFKVKTQFTVEPFETEQDIKIAAQ